MTHADWNNDGHPDLLIGAPRYEFGGFKVGAVQVRAYDSGLDSFPIYADQLAPCDDNTCTQADDDHWFGWSVAAGDFDGDGSGDVAVGWPGLFDQTYTGVVKVFDNGLASMRQVSCGAGTNLFGYAMVSGDVDADGSDDLVVGAPLQSNNGAPAETGAAFVLFNGLTQRQSLSPADYQSPTANNQKFGATVALGNYHGGGLDLAVGAKRAKDDSGFRSGAVYSYVNVSGTMTAVDKLTLDPWNVTTNQGMQFGGALSQ